VRPFRGLSTALGERIRDAAGVVAGGLAAWGGSGYFACVGQQRKQRPLEDPWRGRQPKYRAVVMRGPKLLRSSLRRLLTSASRLGWVGFLSGLDLFPSSRTALSRLG
jgi:hypothetical protein